MCVCFIATLESLQHISAYMGHLQVIFYKYRNTNSCLKLAPATDPLSMCTQPKIHILNGSVAGARFRLELVFLYL
jgi:hypothetical protein